MSARINLSRRQLDVARCAAHGLTEQETGEELGIGIQSVKTHRRKLVAKLAARNATHATVILAMNAPELLR